MPIDLRSNAFSQELGRDMSSVFFDHYRDFPSQLHPFKPRQLLHMEGLEPYKINKGNKVTDGEVWRIMDDIYPDNQRMHQVSTPGPDPSLGRGTEQRFCVAFRRSTRSR